MQNQKRHSDNRTKAKNTWLMNVTHSHEAWTKLLGSLAGTKTKMMSRIIMLSSSFSFKSLYIFCVATKQIQWNFDKLKQGHSPNREKQKGQKKKKRQSALTSNYSNHHATWNSENNLSSLCIHNTGKVKSKKIKEKNNINWTFQYSISPQCPFLN